MACNCKKKRILENKYAEVSEKDWLGKVHELILKIIGFLFVFSITFVLAPIMISVAIFKMFFSKNKSIVLPNFLGKYMK